LVDLAVGRFYRGWQRINSQLLDRVRGLGPVHLGFRPTPDAWPIWATVAHLAGMRVYWLCGVLKEPGGANTPFPAADGMGWEDDLDTPRGAAELALAIETSWRIVDACLDRWTPEMLEQTFRRDIDGTVQWHTRQSVIMRLITHDAYHCGEISLMLGMQGLEPIDLWPPG
jgi:uncharacterized damage-inducible protein DinB